MLLELFAIALQLAPALPLLAASTMLVPHGQERAVALQREVDAVIASGMPATIELSGVYNFSRASLVIAGAAPGATTHSFVADVATLPHMRSSCSFFILLCSAQKACPPTDLPTLCSVVPCVQLDLCMFFLWCRRRAHAPAGQGLRRPRVCPAAALLRVAVRRLARGGRPGVPRRQL